MNSRIQIVLDMLQGGAPAFDFDCLDVAHAYASELEDLDGKCSNECHYLTLALHDLLPGSHVFVVRDFMDQPVFSGLLWSESDLTLSGQGFSTPGDLVRSTYVRGHEECKGAIEPAGMLASEVRADQLNMRESLAKFCNILDCIYE